MADDGNPKVEPSNPDRSEDPNSPILNLPIDTLYQIFSHLPLKDILICTSVCKLFNQTLSCSCSSSSSCASSSSSSSSSSTTCSTNFTLPHLPLLALRRPSSTSTSTSTSTSSSSSLLSLDPLSLQFIRFPLDFLPFPSPSPVVAASSLGLLYLWSDSISHTTATNNCNSIYPSNSSSSYMTSLIVCNPLTRRFRVLPPLGSAWSRHGTVLASPTGHVLVLSHLASFLYSPSLSRWLKFSSNLSSKPRSPVLVSQSVFALADVGSPWRPHWKLFLCHVSNFLSSNSSSSSTVWDPLDRHEWGDVFDILRRPRLVPAPPPANHILMAGGLKSSFSLNNASCSTILILRLDLDSLEWGEAGRMPPPMFKSFQDSSKLKVFGGGGRVFFSGKKVGRLAMWSWSNAGAGDWSWIDGVPGIGDGLCRGFVFDARLDVVP